MANPPNQTTYIDEVTVTGGTSGLGTASTFNLNAKARHLLALIVSAGDTVYTAAEGTAGGQVQIVSASLGLADQRFLTGPFNSSGPATNSSGQGMVPDVIPLEELIAPKGNEQISLAFGSSGDTITTGHSAMLAVMYCQDTPPDYWQRNFPEVLAARGGYQAEAEQLTTTATSLTAISIPSWVTELVASRSIIEKADAITAGQIGQNVMILLSTIPDVAPMKFISNTEGATLGTPVGTGQYEIFQPFVPFYMRSPGGTQTVTPQANLVAAVSTGNDVAFGVSWR